MLDSIESTGAEAEYRPISLLAVGGLCLAVCFGILVVTTALVGFFTGKSALLPGWYFLIAAVSGLMSFAAQWQIRSSDGTRAGMILATLGLWLSIVFGLGFAAVVLTTELTVRNEASRFLEQEFLPRLQAAGKGSESQRLPQLNEAFLLTRPPSARDDTSPNDQARMELIHRDKVWYFYIHPTIRAVTQAGGEAKFRNDGITNCTYREGGYWVRMDINVQTPEAELQVPFLIHSQETNQGRKWYVDMDYETLLPTRGELTSRGEVLLALRKDSHLAAERWLKAWSEGNYQALRKESCPQVDFGPHGTGFDLNLVSNEDRRNALKALFDPAQARPTTLLIELVCNEPGFQSLATATLAHWEIKDQRLQVAHPIQIRFPMLDRDGKNRTNLICRGNVVVERRDGAAPVSFDPKEPPSWCVVRLELTAVRFESLPTGPIDRRKLSR